MQAKKVQTIKVPLNTKAGALNKIYQAFMEANVNIVASWAYEMGPEHGEAIFYPEDFTRAKTLLTKLGFESTTGSGCFVESNDKLGTYAEVLAKIAKANINLTASDAFATNGRFVTMFFADEPDMPALCKALGCPTA